MVAFLGANGRRYDFITMDHSTSPTRTPEEFVALLKATADSAGSSGRSRRKPGSCSGSRTTPA